VIKRRRIGGACSKYGERRGAYRVLVGKPEGERPIRRPRLRWEDNIMLIFGKWDGRHEMP
jgi:hypothetical protein